MTCVQKGPSSLRTQQCALLGASQVKEPPADRRGPRVGSRPGGGRGDPCPVLPESPAGRGPAAAAHGVESDTAERLSTRSRGFLGEPRPETRGAWEEPAEFWGHKENSAEGWSPGKREGPRTGESLGPAPRAGEPLQTAQSGAGGSRLSGPGPGPGGGATRASVRRAEARAGLESARRESPHWSLQTERTGPPRPGGGDREEATGPPRGRERSVRTAATQVRTSTALQTLFFQAVSSVTRKL